MDKNRNFQYILEFLVLFEVFIGGGLNGAQAIMPPKVLIYIHSLGGGGAERVTVALSSYLAAAGYDVAVVTLAMAAPDFYATKTGVRRVTLCTRQHRSIGKFLGTPRRIAALRAILKRENPDVAVGMSMTPAVDLVAASLGLPVRTIVSERNYPPARPLSSHWRLLRRLSYRLADAHVAQTGKTAQWLENRVDAGRIRVIGNCVNWPVPATEPVVPAENFIASGRKMVLAVGTKPWQKGFDLLLDAFAAIAAEHPSWDLAIVGTPTQASDKRLPSLSEMISARGLEGRVVVPGRVGNVGDWYSRADLFVLSSRYEGMPNVLLEAMASGCACVAFDCHAGPRDIITHEKDGLLIPAGDVAALGSALDRLMADENDRKRLREQAIAVRERFSEKNIFGQWERLIADLIVH